MLPTGIIKYQLPEISKLSSPTNICHWGRTGEQTTRQAQKQNKQKGHKTGLKIIAAAAQQF